MRRWPPTPPGSTRGTRKLAIEQKWLAIFQDETSETPLSRQREAMSALFPSEQAGLQWQLLDAMLAPLPAKPTRAVSR